MESTYKYTTRQHPSIPSPQVPSLASLLSRSSNRILRSLPALRCCPIDISLGIFDIASLTMDTVLRVDLESDTEVFALVFDIFVYTGGTEAVFHTFVGWIVGLGVSGFGGGVVSLGGDGKGERYPWTYSSQSLTWRWTGWSSS